MFFPFVAKYQSKVESDKNSAEILLIVKEVLIDEERHLNIKIDDGNECLIFTPPFMQKSKFHAIGRVKIYVATIADQRVIICKFYIIAYFAIFIIAGSVIAYINTSLQSKDFVGFLIYLLMIWTGSMISQKYLFKKFVKGITG